MIKSNLFPYAYYHPKKLTLALSRQTIQVISKPGIPHWNEITPAVALFSEVISLQPGDRVLVNGCGHGALCLYLAQKTPESVLWATDTSFIALQMTAESIKLNHTKNIEVHPVLSVFPQETQFFDAVVLPLPKGRKLARRLLVQALQALKSGGSLFLAGPNQEGIQPAIKDAQALFGNGRILGYKKGNRVARFIKKDLQNGLPDWAKEPGIAPGTWHEFDVEIHGFDFHLYSLPGVFSFERVDEGTHLLLDSLKLPPECRVLDIGCGSGLIGLYASRQGAAWVDLVDSDQLAVASTAKNLENNGIFHARAFPGDILDWIKDERYDCILSNPPFHSGKEVDYGISHAFIQQSQEVLLPGGQLIIVANAFIRYDRIMQQVFGNVGYLAKTGKFHVLAAIKT